MMVGEEKDSDNTYDNNYYFFICKNDLVIRNILKKIFV